MCPIGVAQNQGYNKNGHIFCVFFFVVTLILCNYSAQSQNLKFLHNRVYRIYLDGYLELPKIKVTTKTATYFMYSFLF